MSKIKLNLLYVCLFFVMTQGLWERIFFFIPEVSYIVDISIVVFVFFRFKFNLNVPGAKLFFVLLILGFFLGFANGNSVIDTFLYLRYTLFFYLIYNQLYTLNISLERWISIFKFILFLIIIQGIGSLYNIFVLGERTEGYVGLMSSLGGTTATAFPLFISSLTLLYFIFKPQLGKKEGLIFLLVLTSVFLVGYSSGKRGIYFVIPLFFLITIILALPSLLSKKFFKRKLIGLGFISLIIFPLLIFGIQNSRGLNYALSGNESNFEVISNAIDYAEKYENSTDQHGNTIGRSNTTEQIVNETFENESLFFKGRGYGAMKTESTMLALGFGYGIVGFTRDLISGGWFLMILTFILFARVILTNKSYKFNFTTVFRRLIMLIFIYIHFFYSSDFTGHLKISLILAILISFVNSPYHSSVLERILGEKRILN